MLNKLVLHRSKIMVNDLTKKHYEEEKTIFFFNKYNFYNIILYFR